MILAKTHCCDFSEDTVELHESITSATIFNGLLALGSKKGSIFLLDAENLELKNRLNPHESKVKKLFALSSSSAEKNKDLLVSCSFSGQIALFNSYYDMIDFKKPHGDVIWDMIVLPRDEKKVNNGKEPYGINLVHRLLTVSSDKFMKIHEIDEPMIKPNVEKFETGTPLIHICLSPEPPLSNSSKFFPNKRFLFACDTNRDIRIYDLETIDIIYTFDTLHQGWVNTIFSFYLPRQPNDVLEKRIVLASISEGSSIHLHLVNRLVESRPKTSSRKKDGKKLKKIKTLFRKVDNLHSYSNIMIRIRYLHYCDNQIDCHDPIYVLSGGKDGNIKKVNLSRSECVKEFSNIHKLPQTGKSIQTILQMPNNPDHIISCDQEGYIVKWTLKEDIKALISQEREEKIEDNVFVKYPVKKVMMLSTSPSSSSDPSTNRREAIELSLETDSEKSTSTSVNNFLQHRIDFRDRLIQLLRIKSEEKREKIQLICSCFTIIKMLYQQIKKVNENYEPERIERILDTSRNERKEDIFMILKVRKTSRPYLVHKDIILFKSDFLFKTITFGGQETQDYEDKRVVCIEITDFQNNPRVLDHFIEYMYKDVVSSDNFGVFLNLFHFSNVYFENDLRDYMFEKIKKVSQRLVKERRFEMNLIEYGYLIENQGTLDSLVGYWETLDFGSLEERINSFAFCEQPEELLLEKKELQKKREELERMSEKTREEVKRREEELLKKLKKSSDERLKVKEEFDQREEILRMILDSRRIHGGEFFGVEEKEGEEGEEEVESEENL